MDYRLTEMLIEVAHMYWSNGEPLPLILFADMLEAGLDVETLERTYRQ